ncbi:MAG: 50S ribosomal protein L25 [Kiritimatiellales bacterium]|nr:50S ribosomal protein L25 [Kiritimatiellales bacterium]MCF7863303.1 50S ribosomal protein L25 [Kiritimatiellales bacterium]
MEDTKLIAKKRDLQGSSNSRRLRRTGNIPGVIYGEGKEATAIQLNTHAFEQLLHHHTSENVILEIAVEGEGDVSVLVKDVQHHPVTSELIHVDLLKVDANRPIHVEIALELVGESAGAKIGGSLEHVMHSIMVECLPGNLVESFEIDVTNLQIGDSLHVADLNLGPKFKLLADDDAIIVGVSEPRVETEEEVAEGAVAAEPEVVSKKKTEEA